MDHTLAVPVEVISKIFMCCVLERTESMHPTNAPIILTLVCGRWRGVALSTPSLWSHLHPVDLGGLSVRAHEPFFCALQNWLSLSRYTDLILTIHASNSHRFGPEIVTQYMSILLLHSSRWKYAYIDVEFSYAVFPFVVHDCFPRLEGIDLRANETDMENLSNISLLKAISDASSLLEAGFNHLFFQWQPAWPKIRKVSLRSTRSWLANPSPVQATVLAQDSFRSSAMSNLSSLLISVKPMHTLAPMSSPMLLARLQDLTIIGNSLSLATLLNEIVTPRLQRAKVWDYSKDQSSRDPLLRFFSHCSESLRFLDLGILSIPHAYLTIVQGTPNIVSLAVLDLPLADLNALALHFSPGEQLVSGELLKLEHVSCTLQATGIDDAYLEALLNLVQSRSPRVWPKAVDFNRDPLAHLRCLCYSGNSFQVSQALRVENACDEALISRNPKPCECAGSIPSPSGVICAYFLCVGHRSGCTCRYDVETDTITFESRAV